ncbi:arsenical resistance operon transcriptional repressor ArsD [Nocardia mangyaensis]|uniref:Arsenical resistance operon transcriptional repressor ArsD n=1 Tax=Nocardia mangyaensis TaxID=2213200 RepID=A0A1J0VVE9_9NOCA|nr:arsenite efflux transporter metallochaperone ArsD [Nocardia mangyaensis]APE36048.1 arsenical resistance operon transcriptional repressor ArsD [Nocardia mangyaensis]
MSKIEVYEPALCCNTGVCGPDVDQALVSFSADLDWLRGQGGDITRFNMASEPLAFAGNDTVRSFLEVAGSQGLPLILVDGVTTLTGRYPTRDEITLWSRTPAVSPAAKSMTLLDTGKDSCSGPGCC